MVINDTGVIKTVKKGDGGSCITLFWNDIREWLDNVAADVVQQYVGYDARDTMRKAVITAERLNDDICVIAQVYYCKDFSSDHYDKVTMEMKAPTDGFDDEFIKIITEQGILKREVEY